MDKDNDMASKPYESWATNTTKRMRSSRFVESMLKIGAYLQIGILFVGSILSVVGQYIFSAIALLIFVCLSIDAIRKYGYSGLKLDTSLGARFYAYCLVLLTISIVVNVVVYIRMIYL